MLSLDFPPLPLARFRFDLEVIDALTLPAYKGATLRGGFGYAFKKMVCKQADWRACNPCQGGNDCPYGYIFETSVPPDSQVLTSLREVPIPFVLEPALDDLRTAYFPGNLLSFNLFLIGRAIQYLPYFLLAFEELGRAGLGKDGGRAVLKRIQALHPWRSDSELIFDGVEVHVSRRDLTVTPAEIAARAAAFHPQRLAIDFFTPTRIKHRDQYVTQSDFHILVRALARRISSLAYFHTGVLWQTDFNAIFDAAAQVQTLRQQVSWSDWDRYSTRQQQRMHLGGFAGWAEYEGDLQPFLPLLALGELTHVGKATVFGHGWYQVRV